jgi:pilus assembly protein CpaD
MHLSRKALNSGCKFAAALLAVSALTGCESLLEAERTLPGPPPAKEAKANPTQFGHDVTFDDDATLLLTPERDRLDAFLGRLEADRTDRVFLASAAGADPAIAERRQQTVAAYLMKKGLRVYPMLTDFGAGGPPANAVRVLVRRYVVTLPPCPDFTKYPGHTFDNQVHSNWGCATATNLGMMIANPADLAEGRSLGPADGHMAAEAVGRYHRGETKELYEVKSANPDINLNIDGQSSGSSGDGGK